jgi:hypothetical protein
MQTLWGVCAYRAARAERFIVQFDSARPLSYCYWRLIVRRLARALIEERCCKRGGTGGDDDICRVSVARVEKLYT